MISIFVYPKSATATDLLTNGYGRIECTKCDVSEDINADFYAEIEVPRGSVNEEYVIGGAILKIPCHRGFQYFRIGIPEQNLSVIKAKAWHISYDLAADMIINSWWDAKTAQEALTGILHAGLTETRFSGTTDITTSANLRSVRSSVLSTLIDSGRDNSFVKVWGGEAYRDNFTFDMRSSLGSDGGVRIAYKKNLTGLDIKEDWTQIATRIVPTCLSSADGVLSLPETFIDSTKINDYPYPYVRTIHYSDIKVGQETDGVVLYPDEASAFAAMRERVADLYAAGADVPKTTATVTFAELSKTREYAQYAALESVGLGDTVTAVYRTVALKNRVRGIKFDALTQKITSVTLGDPSRNTLLTTMYAHDVDLSALKSEVTQTVKQGERYNAVSFTHDDGLLCSSDMDGHNYKIYVNATRGLEIMVDNHKRFGIDTVTQSVGYFDDAGTFIGGAAVINSIVTMIAGAMTNDVASGYYAKTGTILDGGVTRHGVGFYKDETLKWFLCQYEVGSFHSIALYDENLIPRISLDADGACYIRDAADKVRMRISASGDFSVWDAADKERTRISASGEFLVWDAAGNLRQWLKGDNSILYSPNGANLLYVNNTNAYKNIGGVVSIL